MDRLVLTAVLVAVAVVVAVVLQRRDASRRDAPTQSAWSVPVQVDRHDFAKPEVEWLVVVFTSSTCDACASVWQKASPLESDAVAVVETEAIRDKELHDRYHIDAVPLLLIADREGVVRASFVGPVDSAELWSTVAGLREAG